MSVKLKLTTIIELSSIVNKTINMPKNPLKFCITRNAKIINPIIQSFIEKRDDEFRSRVKLDPEGNPFVAEGHKKNVMELLSKGQAIPFEWYEYNSDNERDEFFKIIDDLLEEEHELTLVKESLSRTIKLSDKDGNYMDCTLESVLEDPANNIDVNILTVFMEYFLEE